MRIRPRLSKCLPKLCLATACALASPVSPACDDGTAIISGANTYPPLSWREDDHLIGTTIEMAKRLLKEVGIEARTDEGGPWKRVLLRAKRGELDMLVGVRKTPEREKYLLYVDPPITPSVQAVFTPADADIDYQSWEDLRGKVGGITLGASFGEEFDEFANEALYLEETRSLEQNFRKMALGRIDYLLGPLMTVLLHVERADMVGQIANEENELVILDEYIAFSRSSPCVKYADHFHQRIKEFIHSDELNILMEKYFEMWFEQNRMME